MDLVLSAFYYAYKQLHCCKRFVERYTVTYTHVEKISPSKLPWLWIGAKFKNNSTLVSYTTVVNDVVTYGDIVTSDFLSEITSNDPSTIDTWIYIDSTTLEETEIPTEGLIIKDDSVVRASPKET